MKTPSVVHIASRDNPLLKALRKLTHDPAAYRKQGRIWLEGDHLCWAALERGVQPEAAVFSRSLWEQGVAQGWHAGLRRVHVLEDALFGQLSGLESAAQMGYVLDAAAMLQHRGNVDATANTVILDRIQDAGNVGSILRSASANRFLPCRERPHCGHPKSCVQAWGRILACICLKAVRCMMWTICECRCWSHTCRALTCCTG